VNFSTYKMIGELWFPGLTLKTLLNWDLYWNKCTLYIKIEALLKHYCMHSCLEMIALQHAYRM
jgi:hypothetical protein